MKSHIQTSAVLMDNKVYVWLSLATVMILAIPAVAMQFTSQVDWTLVDFLVMGSLIFGSGTIFIQTARLVPHKYRLWLGLGILTMVLLLWIHLAVGIVDTWPLAGS